ncbi:MAG: hypothetical protein ACP5JV_10830 [Thermus sp.]|uniref:hypothetical protein n=1 Tax=Thermus sp. TaxID=275 RepID=UPI003D13D1D0
MPVPGGNDNGQGLLFLPGFPEGVVRFSTRGPSRMQVYLGGTEGPYALNLDWGFVQGIAVRGVFKDAQGRVYAYGRGADGRGLVVRLR